MECFPLDDEIQGSIPFSNNSVVLAANALLQRLLSYAEERNLQSVDVLLSSIWLLIREERNKEKECACGKPYNTVVNDAIQKSPPETTTESRPLYVEVETQTEGNVAEVPCEKTDEMKDESKKDDDKLCKLFNPLNGSLDSFKITSGIDRKSVCSIADSCKNDGGDSDKVPNTVKYQPYLTKVANSELQGPPVLSPVRSIPKESLNDTQVTNSDSKGKAQSSNNLLGDNLEEYGSDEKSFMPKTNVVIENVGSDDSDTQMTIDYDAHIDDSSQTSLKISLDNDIIPQHKHEMKDDPEQKQFFIEKSHHIIDAMPNDASTIASNNAVIENLETTLGTYQITTNEDEENVETSETCNIVTNEDIVIENLEGSPVACETFTPGTPIRESFGGIVEPDSDSDLKIINIAGGVHFYDDQNQSDVQNDRNYFGRTGGTDVVFSSYSSFPNTYMSVNPRLTMQNCPQYFVPNNFGMYTNQPEHLYQPVERQNQYCNNTPSFSQDFQYFFPQRKTYDSSDSSEPVKVKSESRVIMASHSTSPKSKKKKRKKEEENDLSTTKEYYNVRDQFGKFIKKDELPYINNINHSGLSLKGQKPGMKPVVKQELSTGGQLDRRNCHSKKIMRPLSCDGQSGKWFTTGDQGDTKLNVSQLQEECKNINRKLKTLAGKRSSKLLKDMTEKEKKGQKRFEKRESNLLKKLGSLKRKLRKYDKLEYVVRDKGSFVNSSGLSEDYTVVTVKGMNSSSVGAGQSCSKVKQETVQAHDTELDQAKSKKSVSLKQSKGQKILKKTTDKRKIKALNNSNSKIKSAKQKLAAKKILKIRKAKTRQILKETADKNKLKVKQTIDKVTESEQNPGVSEVTGDVVVKKRGRGRPREVVVKKRGRGRPRKGDEINGGKNKVNSLSNRTKTGQLAQLRQARKERDQQEVKEILIAAYHGERGAKLAAQQKISAYNESLSLDNTAKGDN